MADEKKGITVKIDAALHAEIREFIEQSGMTMAEFVSQALYNELHPKIQPQEVKYMGPTRTMAFQMPEEMFQRLKDYLHRHNITQKQFVLGLVEAELNRDQELSDAQTTVTESVANDEEYIDEDEDFDEDEELDEDMDSEDIDEEESEDYDEESEDEELNGDEFEDESEEADEDFSMAM